MEADAHGAGSSRKMVWLSWIVSVLPVLLLFFSGSMKLLRTQQVIEGMAQYGYQPGVILPLGVTEVLCTILYLIPRTSVLGAILLTGYLGGATATHLRAGEPFFAPIIVGVLVWLGLFLREARLRTLIPLRS